MDNERFADCVKLVTEGERVRCGIGTYGEKTVHAVLKNYFEPYSGSHELKIGRYTADIAGENGVIEIQTAGFDRLRGKLDCFLPVVKVTVVYPVIREKWLIPIDPETGETGTKRKSPKRGTLYDIFPELYKIKPYLKNEDLNFCIVMLDAEEYRRPPEKTGLRRGRRKGWTRYDSIPLALREEIHIESPLDWEYFIPEGLPEEFTSKDFAEKAKLHVSDAQLVLNILKETETVVRTGKKGNSFLYRVKSGELRVE